MEENFRAEESFVADINVELLSRDTVHALVCPDPFRRLRVVFREFLGDVWADVGESLLDCFGSFQTLFGRNSNFTFTQQALNE